MKKCLSCNNKIFKINHYVCSDCYKEIKQLLNDNRDMLEFIAKQLLEKETLDEKEFEEMMNEVRSKRSFDNWDNGQSEN